MIRIMILLVLATAVGCSSEKSPVNYQTSLITYAEINAEVGCDSKYVEDKKVDIFNANHINRWMTWKGRVLSASAEDASLNLDDKGIQDLHITFADRKGGYDLMQDEVITVRFLMKVAGGCILPFEGTQAEIIRESKP